MQDIFQRHTNRLASAEARYNGIFVYLGQSFPCSYGPETYGDMLTGGGLSQAHERKVVVRKSVMPANTMPIAGNYFTVISADGINHKLQIQKDGIVDMVYAWEITGEAQAQGL